MGVHQHKGDGEIYYILSGHGLYTDNDTTYEVNPGDAMFCQNGNRHALENIGDEDWCSWALLFTTIDMHTKSSAPKRCFLCRISFFSQWLFTDGKTCISLIQNMGGCGNVKTFP